ncbi:Ribosome-releasing factor 2, mitochondrial [Saitoella coloradoensis]
MLRSPIPRLCSRSLRRPVTWIINHRTYAAVAAEDIPVSRLRNIGIIAHIDAGKTTTTERMLYYSGYTRRIGDVDEGNTVMDYLPAERQRGITITSAAITFPWRNYRLNLIDTPGHADFTFEVARSLRVLDGAVTILDAVAGVEAQTEKVWRQASAHQIPRIVFVNKMDRTGAGFGRTVREVATKLARGGAKVGCLQIPVFENGVEGGSFIGVVDVMDGIVLTWPSDGKSDGRDVKAVPLASYPSPALQEETAKARAALVDTLAELDEEIMDLYLEHENAIPTAALKKAIRRCTLDNTLIPVLTGASFRNIGVQPLLDAVLDYLPSPADRPPAAITVQGKPGELDDKKNDLCALAFKVVHDPRKGAMVFVRVYSGKLAMGTPITNTVTVGEVPMKERANKLLRMYAMDSEEVTEITAGNIGVILGLKHAKTGTTIISSRDPRTTLQLHPIPTPPPVFIRSLEPTTLSDAKGLDLALEMALREDPSLRVTRDDETGQVLLSGMGELHLEVVRERLLGEFGAKAEMGDLRIGYRETVNGMSAEMEKQIDKEFGAGKRGTASAKATVEPHEEEDVEEVEVKKTKKGSKRKSKEFGGAPEEMELTRTRIVNGNKITTIIPSGMMLPGYLIHGEVHSTLQMAAEVALVRGPLISAQLHATHVTVSVKDMLTTDPAPTLTALSQAGRLAVVDAIKSVGTSVVEPVMAVTVTVGEKDLGGVVGDISGTRGGTILSLDEDASSDISSVDLDRVYAPPDSTYNARSSTDESAQVRVVKALVPLREMIGYNKSLRSLTGGRGSFQMSVEKFERVNRDKEREVLKEVRGGFDF